MGEFPFKRPVFNYTKSHRLALYYLSRLQTITYIIIYMPQLVPFYFINQVTFAFAILALLIFVFSKYILPRFVRLFTTRVFISKL